MKVLSYEEFWEIVAKTGKYPDISWACKKVFKTESSKRTRYKNYLQRMSRKEKLLEKKMDKRSSTIDQDVQFRKDIIARDKSCRLKKVLLPYEIFELENNANGFDKNLDVAHIISRAADPSKKYDLDNCVLLNHYSHLMLDQGKNPLNGKAITTEEKDYWFKRIIQGGRNGN